MALAKLSPLPAAQKLSSRSLLRFSVVHSLSAIDPRSILSIFNDVKSSAMPILPSSGNCTVMISWFLAFLYVLEAARRAA